MAETDSSTDAKLPVGELAEAVEACRRQDRRLDMYYSFASPTARRFVELGFYSTYFGEKTDPVLYARCRDVIAPTLSENDLRYLLRFESDSATKAYLNDLLKQRISRQPAPAPSAPPLPAPPPPAKEPKIAGANGKRRQRKSPLRIRRLHPAVSNAGSAAFWMKVLAVLAVLCLTMVIGAIRACLKDRQEQEFKQQRLFEPSSMPDEDVGSSQAARQVVKEHVLSRPQADAVTLETDEAETQSDLPTDAEPDERIDEKATKTPSKAKVKRVALSDGTRIRTRPDGTTEVPRSFSYAGAGLKKPFWIYDPQLEKTGRIEYEARAEKKARDRWKALYDEAVRQEATASSP